MKTWYSKKSLLACTALFLFSIVVWMPVASAQAVLFDFDNAPLLASLPIDQTAGGITAHLSATGQGYSIQVANVLGFTPPGFAGRIIYPNSINLADLLIGFDHTLTDFSIMYCCQELGCDDAATMRVTAYMNGSFVGTNTKTTAHPGTWPVDTLGCSFPQGFNSVVVHYDSPPPTCRDYGTIFMADNMIVTPSNPGIVTRQYAVAAGWNMVSLPLTVADSRTVILYPSSISSAFAFDQSSGYVVRDTLRYREGFWLKFALPENISITGSVRDRDTITVLPGWNLIGTISNPVDTSTIVSIPPGLRSSSWYGYGLSGYAAVTQLTPGLGYWVKATGPGQFVLASPLTGLKSPTQSAAANPLYGLNTLTISDSRGGSQELFFGVDANSVIPSSWYGMPPLPPAGAFDARFETADGGSMARTYSHEGPFASDVVIQSEAYPLTVTWKIAEGVFTLALEGTSVTMSGDGTLQVTDTETRRLTLKLMGESSIPKEFTLAQNYPNPFNPSTTITYDLPVDTRVSLKVFTILGQEVATLVNGEQKAGHRSIEWNAPNFPSGIYFYRLDAGSFTSVRKLLLLR